MTELTERSYKDVVDHEEEKVEEVVKETRYTYEELQVLLNERRRMHRKLCDAKVLDYVTEQHEHICDMFSMLKEKYTPDGFLSVMTLDEFVDLFKRNIKVDEMERSVEDECNVSIEDEDN